MDEDTLKALLKEAEALPDDDARQRWLDSLSDEVREAVLAHARAYAEAAFAAASEHLWVAQEVFDPMSHGETPAKPLPGIDLPPHHHHEGETAPRD
jgi:hypothetical protein